MAEVGNKKKMSAHRISPWWAAATMFTCASQCVGGLQLGLAVNRCLQPMQAAPRFLHWP